MILSLLVWLAFPSTFERLCGFGSACLPRSSWNLERIVRPAGANKDYICLALVSVARRSPIRDLLFCFFRSQALWERTKADLFRCLPLSFPWVPGLFVCKDLHQDCGGLQVGGRTNWTKPQILNVGFHVLVLFPVSSCVFPPKIFCFSLCCSRKVVKFLNANSCGSSPVSAACFCWDLRKGPHKLSGRSRNSVQHFSEVFCCGAQ